MITKFTLPLPLGLKDNIFHRTPIFTQLYAFSNRHHNDFRMCHQRQNYGYISNLNKSLIAPNHVYLNCNAF